MEVGKAIERGRGPFFFFFFCFSLLKTTEICFGSTKMGIFFREKHFTLGKKISKIDFAPSEKYACYAPAILLNLGAVRCILVYKCVNTVSKIPHK